jgi:hypothetical protein
MEATTGAGDPPTVAMRNVSGMKTPYDGFPLRDMILFSQWSGFSSAFLRIFLKFLPAIFSRNF